MNVTLNFNFNDLFLNCYCLPRVQQQLTLDILDNTTDYPYPVEINDTFFFIVNNKNICTHSSDLPPYNIKANKMTGCSIEEHLPHYIYNFYIDLLQSVYSTKTEIRYRIKLNNIVYEILCLPLLHLEDDFATIILHIPYACIQKTKSKIKQNNTLKYIVDLDGEILDILTPKPWNSFLRLNSRKDKFSVTNSIGKNLFTDVIQSEAVQSIYKQLFKMVVYGESAAMISFGWFCDSKDTERQMLMNIERFKADKILLTSTIMKETILYETQDFLEYPVSSNISTVKQTFLICSFCKRIYVSMHKDNFTNKELLNSTFIEPTGNSILLPGTSIPNIGKRGKLGYSMNQSDLLDLNKTVLKAWVIPRQWNILKKSLGDLSNIDISHDICNICNTEWNEFIKKIKLN